MIVQLLWCTFCCQRKQVYKIRKFSFIVTLCEHVEKRSYETECSGSRRASQARMIVALVSCAAFIANGTTFSSCDAAIVIVLGVIVISTASSIEVLSLQSNHVSILSKVQHFEVFDITTCKI